MEKTKRIYVGIDVSKSDFVSMYYNSALETWIKAVIVNEVDAIEQWLSTFDLCLTYFVLEATGPYSERLIHCLGSRCAQFAVVNPAQSRAMGKVLGKVQKNDKQDAKTLAILGAKMETRPYKMPEAMQKKRKEAFSALAALQKQERQLENQLHALSYHVDPNPTVVEALGKVLDSTREAIKDLQEELHPQSDEETEAKLVELITSIQGVGTKTAVAVVAMFGDLQHFDSSKAFSKFIGVCPTEFTSGSSVRGRSKITKNGSAKIRALLFNCARNAIRWNEACKAFFQRMVEKGKNGKAALTAVMHKIARLIFGVVKSGKMYDPKIPSADTICC
jgi:transposase